MGGQTLVQASLLSPSGEWLTVFDARSRDVDVTTSSATPIQYTTIEVDLCHVPFLASTARLTFDTELTQQWLEVIPAQTEHYTAYTHNNAHK